MAAAVDSADVSAGNRAGDTADPWRDRAMGLPSAMTCDRDIGEAVTDGGGDHAIGRGTRQGHHGDPVAGALPISCILLLSHSGACHRPLCTI